MTMRQRGYVAGMEWGRSLKGNGLVSMPLNSLIREQALRRPKETPQSQFPAWRDGFISGVVYGLERFESPMFQIVSRRHLNDS